MGIFGFFKKKEEKTVAPLRILIVEDEPDLSEGLCALLSSNGYQVFQARDGKAGVDLAKKEKPDLIVMDLTMPQMNGFEASILIKQDIRTQTIPILVLTALQMTEDMAKAFKSGADAFMNKPYDNQQILDKIKKLLSGTDPALRTKQARGKSWSDNP